MGSSTCLHRSHLTRDSVPSRGLRSAARGVHGRPHLPPALARAAPGQIDTLIAGRQLRRANWVLQHQTAPFAADPSKVPDPAAIAWFFERLEAEFRALLEETP